MIQEFVIFIIICAAVYFVAKNISNMTEIKNKIVLTKPNASKIDTENIKFIFDVASRFLASASENSITDNIFSNLDDNAEEDFIKFMLKFPTKFSKASLDVLYPLTDAQKIIWFKYRYDIKIVSRKDIKEEVCTIFLVINKFSTRYEYQIIIDKNGFIA